MARIRTIKPEFFTSEQIAECSANARLVFVGMWCFCDDSGVHPASAARLKMEVMPADPISKDQVQALINELLEIGLLDQYQVDNSIYWRVTGWEKHQRIDQPSFKYPLADGKIPPNVRRMQSAEHSPNSTPNVRDGKERKGKEVKQKLPSQEKRGSSVGEVEKNPW
jgi:hypothetical protein